MFFCCIVLVKSVIELFVVGMDEVFVLVVDMPHIAYHLYRQTQKGADLRKHGLRS